MRLAAAAACLYTAMPVAQAQTFPFQLRIQADNSVVNVTNNSTFSVNVDAVGAAVDIVVTATNQSRNEVEIAGTPQLFGPRDFVLSTSSTVTFPLRLAPGASFTFTARLTASTSTVLTGQVVVNYTEFVPSTSPQQTQPTAVSGTITLNLVGTAPEIVVSFALLPDQNVVSLSPGAEIPFGLTPVNTTAQALILLTNRGSGRGSVTRIAVSGDRFLPAGIPLLPVAIPGGGELRFTVRYAPSGIGNDTGTLTVALGSQPLSFALAGRGADSIFNYEILGDTGEIPVVSGQSIPFPDTAVGDRIALTLRIRNSGNANGTLAAVGISGAAFTLSDQPVLPATVRPSGFVTIGLQFAPLQAGALAGRLRIGDDTFNLSGRGIGSQLMFSYSTAETVNTILPGGSVFFSPTAVSQSARLTFTARNTGTTATSIASIGLTDTRNFRIDRLPALPVRLDAGGTAAFELVFTPTNNAQVTSSLLVDAQTFTLSGFGSAPPNLPSSRFTAIVSGPVPSLDQPALGLSLTEPYPIAVQGQLTLNVDSGSNTADPSVQFAAGGRTIAFSIPANTLDAVFANGSNRIRLQTGSVAGVISVSPSFATSSGLDITPSSPPALQLTVAPAAPQLLSVQLTDRTASGFSLVLSGITNTRSLTNLEVTFSPVSGATLSSSRLTVNIAGDAGAWFRATASQTLGGQFSLTLPFILTGGAGGTASLIGQLQSVSATLANGQGVSNSGTANFQ